MLFIRSKSPNLIQLYCITGKYQDSPLLKILVYYWVLVFYMNNTLSILWGKFSKCLDLHLDREVILRTYVI